MRSLVLVVAGVFVGVACKAKTEQPIADDARPRVEPVRVSVGVFPYMPAVELEHRFGPVLRSVQQSVGADFELSTAKTFSVFHDRLEAERYDLALIQPFDYVRLSSGTYIPVARFETDLDAIFVSRVDAPVDKLSDLEGKVLALPAKHAAVSYLARDALASANVNAALHYQRNHASCLQLVLAQQAAACATARIPLHEVSENLHVELHVGVQTATIPHVLWVVHKRVPKDRRSKIRDALLDLSATEDGRELLRQSDLPNFIATTDRDYDSVRALMTRAPPKDETSP